MVEGVDEDSSSQPSPKMPSLRRNLLQTQFRRQFETPSPPPRAWPRPSSRAGSVGSPIEGPTPNNTHNFKMSLENLHEKKALQEVRSSNWSVVTPPLIPLSAAPVPNRHVHGVARDYQASTVPRSRVRPDICHLLRGNQRCSRD
jgi:hypothetical protein